MAPAREAIRAIGGKAVRGPTLPFSLVLGYLFFEFGRPQALLPPLEVLHVPAILAVLLVLSLARARVPLWRDRQTQLLLWLFALMFLHIPIAMNNFFALAITRVMLITFVAYLGIITFIDSTEKFKKLINLWLIIHVYLAINGILKGGRGIGGFIADENDFCMALNMALPFPFFMGMSETRRIKKLAYFAIALLILFTIMATLSRGGFVGLVGVGGYCWMRSKRKALSAFLIVLLAFFMFLAAPPTYWDEVRSIQEEGSQTGTGEDRVYLWKIAWKMFLHNPILGVGQGNVSFQFEKYETMGGNTEGLHGRSRAGRAMHSLYFTLLPEWGLVGTVLYGMIVYRTYRDVRFLCRFRLPKNHGGLGDAARIQTWGYAMEGSLVAFFVCGIFISVLTYPSFWVMMGFVIALRKIALAQAAQAAQAA